MIRDVQAQWRSLAAPSKLYHGTNVQLRPGDTLKPAASSGRANYDDTFDLYNRFVVYLSDLPHNAEKYALGAVRKHGGEPHVYQVRAIGVIYRDPEYEDSGFGSDQWCATMGEVISEIPLPGNSHLENGQLMRGPAKTSAGDANVPGSKSVNRNRAKNIDTERLIRRREWLRVQFKMQNHPFDQRHQFGLRAGELAAIENELEARGELPNARITRQSASDAWMAKQSDQQLLDEWHLQMEWLDRLFEPHPDMRGKVWPRYTGQGSSYLSHDGLMYYHYLKTILELEPEMKRRGISIPHRDRLIMADGSAV